MNVDTTNLVPEFIVPDTTPEDKGRWTDFNNSMEMSPIHEHAEDDLTVPPTPDLDGPLKEDSDPLLNQTSCFPEDKKN